MNNEDSSYENIESLQKTIDNLVVQIEILSNKSRFENNRKNPRTNILEYSTAILHLSKTLGELVLIKNSIVSGKSENLMKIINGRN